MKKRTVQVVLFALSTFHPFILAASLEKPDFGPRGLAGLSEVKIWRLSRGEIVLPDGIMRTPEGKTLIEAALVFDRPPSSRLKDTSIPAGPGTKPGGCRRPNCLEISRFL